MAIAEHYDFYLIKYTPKNISQRMSLQGDRHILDSYFLLFWHLKKSVNEMVLIPIMTGDHRRKDDKKDLSENPITYLNQFKIFKSLILEAVMEDMNLNTTIAILQTNAILAKFGNSIYWVAF